MPQPATAVQPRTRLEGSAVRIVLFGRTDAGKSSLLGALLQAAQTQAQALSGHLLDLTHGLAELQRRLYDEEPHSTPQEIVAYPITFEPLEATGTARRRNAFQAVVIDCDGQVANRILERRRALQGSAEEGKLAQAILDADALVLVVDASADAAQVDADFAQFERFLRLLELSRGHLAEVSGQPVFLVLTKCDLLVRPGEALTFAGWVDRMEEQKHKVAARLREFLARYHGKEPAAFGRLDLRHIWATAVRRPALADTPARPRDPYGVAELFRQCLDDARAFRQRRQRSNWWLFGLIVSSLAAAAGLCGLVILFLIFNLSDHAPNPLQTQISRWQARQDELTPLARHRKLAEQIDQLEEWVNDPRFGGLPGDLQTQVRRRLDELRAYREYAARLDGITDPRQARSMSQLQEITASLARVQVPPDYAEEWKQTDACRRQADELADAAAILAEVPKVLAWYQKLIQDGTQVLEHAREANLPSRAKKVVDEARNSPFPADPERLLPAAKRATYATVFEFTSVAEARRKWDQILEKLRTAAELGSGKDGRP
jgi:hypothetical protein